MTKEKKILDVCCGGKMFWFNKKHPKVLFVDKRKVNPIMIGKGKNKRIFSCLPDKIMDFRKLDLPSNTFSLVVFDPPHFIKIGDKSYMAQKYGRLDPTWKNDLREGFNECFRVLKENGVLIFKWNEYDIKVSEIIKLSPFSPLFGHPSGKMQRTHWLCFMKLK